MTKIFAFIALILASSSYAAQCGMVALNNTNSQIAFAQGISDSGSIVGYLRVTEDALTNAFLRIGPQLIILPGLDGGAGPATAYAITRKGDIVVGGALDTTQPGVFRPVLWRNGVIEALRMTDRGGFALAVNDSGVVVGISYGISGHHQSAFQWKDGHFVNLNRKLKAFESAAYGVNNRGQVVGWRRGADFPESRAFLFEPRGTYIDLGDLGGSRSAATGINDAGQVVGWSYTKTQVHAFVWQNGVMTDLGTLSGFNKGLNSNAYAINANGDITGASQVLPPGKGPEQHAFLWKAGTMTDLGKLGGNLSTGRAINVHGHVVGNADPTDIGILRMQAFRWKVPCQVSLPPQQ